VRTLTVRFEQANDAFLGWFALVLLGMI